MMIRRNFIIPNAKQSFLTLSEKQILKARLGKPIISIYKDAFVAVILIFEDKKLIIRSKPDEGIALNEYKKSAPTEIMRIEIEDFKRDLKSNDDSYIFLKDEVQSIQIARSVLLFSEPEIIEGDDYLKGKEIELPPRGKEYQFKLLNPFASAPLFQEVTELAKANVVNQIDVGILLELSKGKKILIHTNGVSYGVKVKEDFEVENFLGQTALMDLYSM